jgi:hypothetical protein
MRQTEDSPSSRFGRNIEPKVPQQGDTEREFVRIIDDTVQKISDVTAFAVLNHTDQIPRSYYCDEVPDLPSLEGREMILKTRPQGDFVGYSGMFAPVEEMDI